MFCFCFACICVYPVAYRRRYADHCVLASSRLLKFKTWLLFFLFFLFNTYYLLSNENPLFVILSLVACFFTQSSILYYSFFPHFTLLFTFSFRVKFVWYLWFIVRPLSHNHLSHFIIWFTRVKIVHHRLRLLRLYLQKYSLTLIIEISRFLMSRLHNLLLPLVPYTLVYYSWWSCLGELKVLLSDETKVTPRKGWDLLVVETSFNVCVLLFASFVTYP